MPELNPWGKHHRPGNWAPAHFSLPGFSCATTEASAQLLERDTSAEGNVTRHGNFAMNANADGYTLTAGSSAAAVQVRPPFS
jgi:hypothetical protein